MKDFKAKKFKKYKLFFIPIFFLVVFGVGYLVMFLWNAILPDVTRVQPITYWQAMGILLLSKILFGGFKGCGPKHHNRECRQHRGMHKLKHKWGKLNDQQKEKIEKKWFGSADDINEESNQNP